MDILAIAKIILLYVLVILVIWLLFFDGPLGRAVYNAHPQIISYVDSPNTNRPVFVYFTGTQSSGKAHSAQLRELWGKHYDVVVVEYSRKNFDGPVIVEDVHEWLRERGYRRVILDGASVGFLLSCDLIDYDWDHGELFEFVVVAQDGLTGASDLVQAGGAKFMSHWDAGPVANVLFTRLFWIAGFNPPARETLGSGVDDELLAEHYQASKTWPLSGWTGQLRYNVKRRTFHHGQYGGVSLIIMQSQNDSVVKAEAADKLSGIFGSTYVIPVPETTHIGFMEYPNQWWMAFEEAFVTLKNWGW